MIVLLNGKFLEEDKVFISPFDRGFLYGDGVFETLASYEGEPIFWQHHMLRMKAALSEMKLPFPCPKEELYDNIKKLLKLNALDGKAAYIRITVTRGITKGLRDFSCLSPTYFAYVAPLDSEKIAKKRELGVKAFFVSYSRGDFAHLKHLGYLPSLKALMEADEVSEPLFVRGRKITEGATSNIFFCEKERIVTPKEGMLRGVMRDVLLDFFKRNGLIAVEDDILKDDMEKFDAAFITNSIIEILPVREIEGRPFKMAKVYDFIRLFEKYKKDMLRKS